MKSFSATSGVIAASILLFKNFAFACNPLTAGTCPAVTALGTTVNVDFTAGASTQLPGSLNVITYESDGVHLTVAEQGDSPILTSPWYIMFGRFEIVFKSAPGVGMVSSAILQSDDLDEIDWELLGATPAEAQTNYFGRGETETYDREVTVADATSQSAFNTYVIDWNEDRIIWSINGVALRTLNAADADVDTSGRSEYPQTPMQVKIGAWAGGDPSNPSGTISWAGGEIDYSAGPYTMVVQSVSVTDYSTGSQYSYNSGSNGSWHDITATGGTVLGNSAGATVGSSGSSASSTASSQKATSSTTVASSAAASAYSSTANAAGSSTLPSSYETFPTSTAVLSSSSVNTRTGWPWVGTAASTSSGSTAVATTSTMSYTSAGSSSVTTAAASSAASSLASSAAVYSSQASGTVPSATSVASSSQASGAASSQAYGAASSQAYGATSSANNGAGSATTMITYATSVTTVNAGSASSSAASGSSASSGASASTAVSAVAQSQGVSSTTSAAVATYTGGAGQKAIAKMGIAICAAAGLVLAA